MKKIIFRLGDTFFHVRRNWFQLPQNVSLGNIADVAVDNKDNVYLLQREEKFMMIFSSTGKLEEIWENKDFLDVHQLHIAPDGRIFVTDRDAHCIVIFSPSGEIIGTIGKRNSPQELGKPFNHPTCAVCTSEGEIFISDGYGNYSVHHFNSSGNLVHSWGKPGYEEGCFSTPHSLLLTKDNNLLVADRENNRIQVFNQQGHYLRELRNIYHPMAMTEDPVGNIYATAQSQRILAFGDDGRLIGCCRSFGMYAHGISSDRNGNFFTAEMGPNWITKFEKIDK